MKKFLAIAAAAVLGVSGMAMAEQVNNETVKVNVKIVVPQIVSIWGGDGDVVLTVGQSDGSGYAALETPRSMGYIANVDATISATVDGTLPGGAGGNNINFFLFDGDQVSSPADVKTLMVSDAYNPAGALTWNGTNLGTTKVFKNVAKNLDGSYFSVMYAASMPGGIMDISEYDLEVTWTIAPQD